MHDTDRVLSELNGMVNRLILGMIVSGFAVGTGLLMQLYFTTGMSWMVQWLLGIGMAIVVGVGSWLSFSILLRLRR